LCHPDVGEPGNALDLLIIRNNRQKRQSGRNGQDRWDFNVLLENHCNTEKKRSRHTRESSMVGYWKRREEMKMFLFDVGAGKLRTACQLSRTASAHGK